MRIALIQPQAELAGAQRVALMLADRLKARGHVARQIFFYRKSPGFPVDSDTIILCDTRPIKPHSFALMLQRLFYSLRDFEADSAITFQQYGNIIGAPIARLAGVRHVIANQSSVPDAMTPVCRVSDRWLGRLGVYSANVANSRATLAAFDRYPARYFDRLRLIPHGVRVFSRKSSKSVARRELGLPDDGAVLICSVGRLSDQKNHSILIPGIAMNPSWHLVIAGEGPLKERLKATAVTHNCGARVHLVGEMNDYGLQMLFDAADVFVFPSTWETFGLGAAEALAYGLPSALSDIPVLHEIAEMAPQRSTSFFNCFSSQAAARAIERALSFPSSAQVSNTTYSAYSIEAMADAYTKLFTGSGQLEAAYEASA